MENDEIKEYGALNVLTATLRCEAEGEPIEGIIAAGCVIRNRVWSNRWPKTYEDVCLQRKQFSCWNLNEPIRQKGIESLVLFKNSTNKYYNQCRWVAHGIIYLWALDNTGGANHYFNPSIVWPDWAANFQPCAKYGNHLFFRL